MALPGLRPIREQRGLTQEELARLAHVSTSTVARAEQGKQNPRLEALVALADALMTTTDELFGRPVPENDKALTDASPASAVRA